MAEAKPFLKDLSFGEGTKGKGHFMTFLVEGIERGKRFIFYYKASCATVTVLIIIRKHRHRFQRRILDVTGQNKIICHLSLNDSLTSPKIRTFKISTQLFKR